MNFLNHVKPTVVHKFQFPSKNSLLIYFTAAHFENCFVNIFCHRFKSPRIHWSKHSWLMDSINLMTSKPRRENMFMRSIMPTERHWNQQHYWEMKAHLFSSAAMCSVFIPEGQRRGYPHKMLMMCCLLRGSVINLCVQATVSRHYSSTAAVTNRRRGGEGD